MKTRFFLVSFLYMLFIVYVAFAGTIEDDFEDGKIADFWNTFPEELGRAELVETTDEEVVEVRLPNVDDEEGVFLTTPLLLKQST